MMRVFSSLAAVLLSFLFAPSACEAAVLFSNYGQTPLGYGPQLFFTTTYRAMDFQTGADGSVVTGATVGLANQDSITRTAYAEIWSDNAGAPGSLVGSFDSFQTLTPGQFSSSFAFSDTGITLAALTKYWMVMRAGEDYVNPSSLRLFYTDSTVDDGGNPFSSVAGTDPQISTNSGASWSPDTYGSFFLTLQGDLTAAPEPARAVLLMVGLFATGLRRRRPVLA